MDTDYDRIERAFDSLRKRGYFAAQDWTCCSSCGLHAIQEIEVEDAWDFEGLVFSHAQGHDGAYLGTMDGIEPPGEWDEDDPDFDEEAFFQACDEHRASSKTLVGDLYFTWDAPDGDAAPIVEALRAEGLEVEAPPDISKTIRVIATMPVAD